MAGTRKDIAKLNGPWSDEMLWYARAVRALQGRAPADRTSWWYLAAIHGIDIPGWVQQGIVPSASSLPPQGEQDLIFNQCQHAGWFFLPWHRGYLAAFEAILDAWISAQPGGPQDWALPYWNYLSDSNPNGRAIPPEFLDPTLPDGSANPLSQVRRNGMHVLGPQPWFPGDISLSAQTRSLPFTAAPGTEGYGGAISGFAQQGSLTGAVEGDPHNRVHVMVGGVQPVPGWMSDPDYAALDPIFWVHHCNIDRFWAAWMSDPANQQEDSGAWSNGPFPRQFLMPNPAGGGNVFLPGETLPGGALAPAYDDLHDGTGIPQVVAGGPVTEGVMITSKQAGGSALLGSNSAPLTVAAGPAATEIAIPATAATEFAAPPGLGPEPRLYLNLEGVRGAAAAGVLQVHLRLPGADGGLRLVDTVALFGLGKASSTEGVHAGNGLSLAIDITELAREVQSAAPGALERLSVELSQPGTPETEITVERVSLYRQEME